MFSFNCFWNKFLHKQIYNFIRNMSSATSIDSVEEQERKFRILCKFRAITRRVIENSKWLIERDDDAKNIDNVKGHIIKLLYGSIVLEHGLTLNDKSLMCKPSHLRTDDERYYLYKKIGNLNMFSIYTTEVKMKLAAHTYFRFIKKGRLMLREGHRGQAMYFILSGQIETSKRVYDKINKSWSEEKIAILGGNDTVGMISLIYNVPTNENCITIADCELLYVERSDFDDILKPTMFKQWEDVKKMMMRFIYFSSLTEVEMRDGCLLAKIKEFNVNETIFGDGIGFPNFVYFVIAGKCQLIETIEVSVRKTINKIVYSLHTQGVPPKPSTTNVPQTNDDQLKPDAKSSNAKIINGIMDLQKLKINEDIFSVPSKKYSINPDVVNITTVFMQVCLYEEGSCFNLGESFNNRRIVAAEKVTCLLLPATWLWKHNTADIWARVKHFILKKLPTTEQVFDRFVMNRRWSEYKQKILEEIVNTKKAVNPTTVHDVPYSVRIHNKFI